MANPMSQQIVCHGNFIAAGNISGTYAQSNKVYIALILLFYFMFNVAIRKIFAPRGSMLCGLGE
jgi:hypothetical protein